MGSSGSGMKAQKKRERSRNMKESSTINNWTKKWDLRNRNIETSYLKKLTLRY
jgi:hypothetical protein